MTIHDWDAKHHTTYTLYNGNAVTLNTHTISVYECGAIRDVAVRPSGGRCIREYGQFCDARRPRPLPHLLAYVTQLTYDAAGDLIDSSMPDGNSGGQLSETTNTYDGDGERTDAVSPDGNVSGGNASDYDTHTGYDVDGNVTSSTQGFVRSGGPSLTVTARETDYWYDADNNEVSETDPRGPRYDLQL